MKKTWLSYPLWLLYAILTGAFAAAYLSWMCIHVWDFGQYLTAAAIGLVFCGTVGIWFAGCRLALWAAKWTGDKHLVDMLECFLVLCLCSASVLYRLYLALHFDGDIGGSAFFGMAAVKDGGGVSWAYHGASYLYTAFLSFVLSFTGNKEAAGVMLQLVLQALALPLFYFAVRLLAGRGEAVCALAVMAFAPDVCNGMFSLGPAALYFLLYAFGLLLCGFYRRVQRGTPGVGNKGNYVLLVLCGVYLGFAGFLDVTGWTLLLPMAFSCMREGEKASGAVARLAVCAAVSAAAVFALLGICAASWGYPYGEMLSGWLEYPTWKFLAVKPEFFSAGVDASPWFALPVCLCAALAVIGFWYRDTRKQDGWILLLFALSAFRVTGIGGMDCGILLTAAWGILAGIGICSMGSGEEGVRTGTESLQTAEGAEQGGKEEQAEKREKAEKEKGETGKKGRAYRLGRRRKKVRVPDLVVEELTAEPDVKFIENPLPLPKKHVKREMTYAKEPERDEMEFDVPWKDGDDFDI